VPPAPLLERELILIGDFENRTGEPMFDDILRHAVEVKFEQSPYVTVLPATRTREVLAQMRRAPDEVLVADVAREISERAGIKAFTVGSIASVGGGYVLRLDVINARTGAYLARQQSEAGGQDDVLAAIDRAASATRRQLGESLQSIARFDVPVAVATTGSLEALRAFRLGLRLTSQGTAAALRATGFFKRAIELDPDFALAHAQLGIAYRNVREYRQADAAMRLAFARRHRAGPRERLQIEAAYYGQVSGEIGKAVETMHEWAATYPDDARPHNSLMAYYKDLGRIEQAVEHGERAVAMQSSALYRANLAGAYVRTHQFDRAIAVGEAAIRDGADNATTHRVLHTVARITHDRALAEREEAWMSRRTQDFAYISYRANLAGSEGRMDAARLLFVEAINLAGRAGLDDRLEQSRLRLAMLEIYTGNGARAIVLAGAVLAADPSEFVAADAAFVLALAGDARGATVIKDLVERNPDDEYLTHLWQPLVAGIEAAAAGALPRAIETWRLIDTYDRGDHAWLRPSYHLGLARLATGATEEARARFQKVIEHQGVHFNRPLFALAHLGLARTQAALGNAAGARAAYEQFFAVWSAADAELPIMREARREYARIDAAS
jgi:tetratricopeptide (TPR) repeat protein